MSLSVDPRALRSSRTSCLTEVGVEIDGAVWPMDLWVVLLEPGGSKDNTMMTDVGHKEMDLLMMPTDNHRSGTGSVRDGA